MRPCPFPPIFAATHGDSSWVFLVHPGWEWALLLPNRHGVWGFLRLLLGVFQERLFLRLFLEDDVRMNIGSGKGYPLSHLCSDSLHAFELDGVKCASFASFVQGLKFERPGQQAEVCRESPKAARERGKKALAWKNQQTLWWKGVPMERESKEHAELLQRAISQMGNQCQAFRKALLETGDMVLESQAQSKPFDHPVTEAEYCKTLTTIRERMRRHALA